MSRDITKAIADYEKKFEGASGKNGAFYSDDLQQIREMATEPLGSSDRDYQLIYRALEAGFMVGYRKGKRENSKRRAAGKA